MNFTNHDSQDLLGQCTELLERLDDLLAAHEPLSPHEVRHLPKLARRREVAVTELAAVCKDAGIDGAGIASLDEMTRSSDEAIATRRALERLDLVRGRLDAKRLKAQARTVRHVNLFYDLVRRAAVFDDDVRERVGPIVDLWKTRHRRSASLSRYSTLRTATPIASASRTTVDNPSTREA